MILYVPVAARPTDGRVCPYVVPAAERATTVR